MLLQFHWSLLIMCDLTIAVTIKLKGHAMHKYMYMYSTRQYMHAPCEGTRLSEFTQLNQHREGLDVSNGHENWCTLEDHT